MTMSKHVGSPNSKLYDCLTEVVEITGKIARRGYWAIGGTPEEWRTLALAADGLAAVARVASWEASEDLRRQRESEFTVDPVEEPERGGTP